MPGPANLLPPAALIGRIHGDVEVHLAQAGTVFASFVRQDSGCRSYGVAVDGQRWFIKASHRPDAVPSLRRAMALHATVSHPAIVPLAGTATTDGGLVLVYPWVDGEVLYGAPVGGRDQRLDPSGPHARFRALPVPEVLAAVDVLLDAHLAIADAGYVAVDLYDGCFLYDFVRHRMWLCVLDEYRPGPFTLEVDRLPGSTRFMAPEEWQRGESIDQRTTVYNLGRAVLVLLNEADLDGPFRGPPPAASVAGRATEQDRRDRYATVAEMVAAWRRAAAPARD